MCTTSKRASDELKLPTEAVKPSMVDPDTRREDTARTGSDCTLSYDGGEEDINCKSGTRENNNRASRDFKRGVSFDKIHIREYSRCLGNNPAVTHGPPLSIDWKYQETGSYGLEEYEETRPPRRAYNQMLVPGDVREGILLEETNVSKKQINAVVSEIQATRHKRQMSVVMQEFEDWHVAAETVWRRIRRWSTGVTKKREQELVWENAQRYHAENLAHKELSPTPRKSAFVIPTLKDASVAPVPSNQ